jgi:protein SCO1/2
VKHTAVRALAVGVGIVLLVVGAIGYGVRLGRTERLATFGEAPAFSLTDQFGRPVSSDELRDKVVVADFIYTTCPDICPLLSIRMQTLQERLREETLLGRHVQLLSFTVDPVRDTPAVLRTYAEQHRADPLAWRFLTGPEGEMRRIVQQGFLLGVQKMAPQASAVSQRVEDVHADNTYQVMHSTRFVLIDRQGRIRAYYDARELDLERVVHDIHLLLQQ